MTYLGEYSVDIEGIAKREKLIAHIKQVPLFGSKMKDIEFCNHISNLVLTKAELLTDQNEMICSIYVELFGAAFNAAERVALLKQVEWLNRKQLVRKYSKYEYYLNKLIRFLIKKL